MTSRSDELLTATTQHLEITVISVLVGLVVAFPLALLVRRTRVLKGALLGATTVLYAIPSLALIPAMVPFTGLSLATVVVPLILYSLVVLLRNILAGLDAVPAAVLDAARGMGYGPGRLLWSVELPLALPAIVAGVRIATVSTVAMATIGSLVGFGGLGNLLLQGQRSFFNAQVLTAAVAVVVLALVLDLLLLAVQRALSPRRRARTAVEVDA